MLTEDVPRGDAMEDGDLPTESGGKSTNPTEGPAMASPRLIPILEPPYEFVRTGLSSHYGRLGQNLGFF